MNLKTFNPSSKHPARAVQAWQILVGKAMNRQTVTYLGLSRLMYGKDAQGVLDKILGHVAFYCIDNDLPPLSAIVVNKGRGRPGDDIPIPRKSIDAERERVFAYDWYNVCPPDEASLAASYATNAA